VLKLNRGDEVTILRSEYGWLEITPPPGAYSLVEKTRIDLVDDSNAVANDLVQVYAGSDLDSRHYAKQVKLGKGEKVRILGETEGGDFYKIAPPPGATLWITGDYVRRGTAEKTSSVEPIRPGELSQVQSAIAGPRKNAEKPRKAPTDQAAAPAPKPQTQLTQANRDQIRAIEAEIADELRKAPTEQVLEPIVGKLQKLADQKEDLTAQLYAQARIEQLRNQMELAAAVSEMKHLRENAVSQADAIARERLSIRNPENRWKVDDIAARGEIRVSGLYDGSGGRAKRWRLVDPKTNRTDAYIELPPGSAIDPIQYYGKYVGVRATSYQLLHGTVPPLPVYVVNDITVLDPATDKPGVIRKEAIASPEPRLVEPPASQPSASRAPDTRPAAE